MLGAALLGGLKGGANAVNTLSEERRRQLAEQLRMETLEAMNQRQQERGFKHAEGMEKGRQEFQAGESALGRTHAEGLFDRREAGEDRRLDTQLGSAAERQTAGFSHAEGMQQSLFGQQDKQQSALFGQQDKLAKATEKPPEYSSETIDGEIYWINKSNPNDRHHLGAAAGEKLSPKMQENFWDAAGKQARGELGSGFLGFGGPEKKDLYEKQLEIFNRMLKSTGKKGEPPTKPDPTAQTINPSTPGLLSPDQVEKAKPAAGGFSFQDFVPQSQPAPTSAAPNKMQGAIAATDQANPLFAGPGKTSDGVLPTQEAPMPESEGVNPTRAMQSRIKADPEGKAAAIKEAKVVLKKVTDSVAQEIKNLGDPDKDWAAQKILGIGWDMLSDELRRAWASYDEFIADIMAGQKDARKALGLDR